MARQLDVIDSDAHVLEPGDLWKNFLEPRFRDRAPGIVTRPDGSEVFALDKDTVLDMNKGSEAGHQTGLASIGGFGMRYGIKPKSSSYSAGRAGGFDPKLRLPDMDAEGIDAAFLYPSLALFLFGIKDPELAAATARAYNRWLSEYCSAAPDRLFGVAILPMQSPQACVEEIRFVRKELGFRAGFVRPNPFGKRVLHHPENDPVWRAAEENDLAIAVHSVSASAGMPLLGEDRYNDSHMLRHCATHTLEMIGATTSFILAGVCERFPKLRVGFMEAGGGWMPAYLDRMDRHFDDKGKNTSRLKLRPSDVFERQCFISFEPIERTLPLLADLLGRDHVLWASDYPHGDGYADAPGLIRKLGLAPDLYRDVMHKGAKKFYGLT